jgi:hypothetical protein
VASFVDRESAIIGIEGIDLANSVFVGCSKRWGIAAPAGCSSRLHCLFNAPGGDFSMTDAAGPEVDLDEHDVCTERTRDAAKFWIDSTDAGTWTRVDIKPEPMVYFRRERQILILAVRTRWRGHAWHRRRAHFQDDSSPLVTGLDAVQNCRPVDLRMKAKK